MGGTISGGRPTSCPSPMGRLEAWSHTLSVGQPLPTLPLWLREDLVMALDLEQSYEQACSDLWIS